MAGEEARGGWMTVSSGEAVPGLGLGMAALGRPGYINLTHASDFADRSVGAMEAQAHAVLDAAYARGVRYFDAARSYGRAEAFLAGLGEDERRRIGFLAGHGHAPVPRSVRSVYGGLLVQLRLQLITLLFSRLHPIIELLQLLGQRIFS